MTSNNKVYNVLARAKSRCNNPNDPKYRNYGARGIEFRFDSLTQAEKYVRTLGYKEGLTLDRIDVDGHYEVGNLRWVDWRTQLNNKRNNHYIEYDGHRLTISQWAEVTGIPASTIYSRVSRQGWDDIKAITTPSKGRHTNER